MFQLTAEQMNLITKEATLGKAETSVPGQEAKEFFDNVKAEVDAMKKQGVQISMLPD